MGLGSGAIHFVYIRYRKKNIISFPSLLTMNAVEIVNYSDIRILKTKCLFATVY